MFPGPSQLIPSKPSTITEIYLETMLFSPSFFKILSNNESSSSYLTDNSETQLCNSVIELHLSKTFTLILITAS